MQISEANIHFSLFSSYIQYSSWIQNHTSSWLEHLFANQDLVQYLNLIMKEMINKHFLDTEVHPCTCSYKNKQEGTTIQMWYCSMHILAQELGFLHDSSKLRRSRTMFYQGALQWHPIVMRKINQCFLTECFNQYIIVHMYTAASHWMNIMYHITHSATWKI